MLRINNVNFAHCADKSAKVVLSQENSQEISADMESEFSEGTLTVMMNGSEIVIVIEAVD